MNGGTGRGTGRRLRRPCRIAIGRCHYGAADVTHHSCVCAHASPRLADRLTRAAALLSVCGCSPPPPARAGPDRLRARAIAGQGRPELLRRFRGGAGRAAQVAQPQAGPADLKKIAGPPAGLTGWAGNFAGILSLRFSFNKTAAALLAPSLQQALHRICPCRVGHRRVCPRRHSRCTELRAAAKMLIN